MAVGRVSVWVRFLLAGAAVPMLFALLLLLPSVSTAAQQPPYFQRFDVEIELWENGDFIVTEEQVVVFGRSSARQGFREIPLDRVVEITDVSVSEPGREYSRGNGAQHSFRVEREAGTLFIDWWFPPTANAARHFIVRYRVVGGLRYYPGGDQLFWKAIYADRDLPIEAASVTVRFPADLSPDQVMMAAYPEGLGAEERLVDSRTVRFQAAGIPDGTGLEVRVQFPHGLVSGEPPPWQAGADRADWYDQNARPLLNLFLGALGLLVALGGSLWVFLAWYSRGRDPLVGEVPRTLSEPPDGLPPALAGTLVDGRADVRDVVATIVQMARLGVLRIVEEQRPQSGKSGRQFRLELLKEPSAELRDYQRLMVRRLFAGTRSARFSELGPRFRSAIPEVQKLLHHEMERIGLFSEDPEKVRNRYLLIGFLLLGGGMALGGLLLSLLVDYVELVWAPFAGLAVAGSVGVAFAFHMPSRTEAGALAAARWRAFARHLGERRRLDELSSHQEDFESYLPFAIAFGVDRQWVREFAEAGTPAPDWYRVEPYPTVLSPRGGRSTAPGAEPQAGAGRDAGGELKGGGLPGLQGMSDRGALSLQSLSDGLVEMLNTASRSLSSGGSSGGWSGGGRGGGGGGGGGRGGFR